MKMSKIIAFSLMLAMVTTLMTGCQTKKETTDSTSTSTPTESTGVPTDDGSKLVTMYIASSQNADKLVDDTIGQSRLKKNGMLNLFLFVCLQKIQLKSLERFLPQANVWTLSRLEP